MRCWVRHTVWRVLCCVTVIGAFQLVGDMVRNRAAADQMGVLHVSVDGLTSSAGEVVFALYDSPERYVEKIHPSQSGRHAVSDRQCTFSLDQLAYGDYVLILYHDENDNGSLDKSWYGRPTEAVGFSNNVRPRLSLPPYRRVVFALNQPVQEMTILVR